MQYLITPLLEVLNPTNTVSRNRLLSFAIGNAEAEIYNCLIAKHVYYNNQGKLTEGGWFYSTVKDLHLSSGYAEDAQKTAIRHLIKHGLIESELKGLPAKRYFRIIPDVDKLNSLMKSGEEIQEAVARRYDDEIKKRSDRRKKKKLRIIEVTDTSVKESDTIDTINEDTASETSSESVMEEVTGNMSDISFYVSEKQNDMYSQNDERVSRGAAPRLSSADVRSDVSEVTQVDAPDSYIDSNYSCPTPYYVPVVCSPAYGGTSPPEPRTEIKEKINQRYFIENQSFIHSVQNENFVAVESVERGIERAKHKLSFREIIEELGFDYGDFEYLFGFYPNSESDLRDFSDADRGCSKLTFPETLRTDRKTVLTALKFLCASEYYSYQRNGEESSLKGFIDVTLGIMADLIMADDFKFNGKSVSYTEVIDEVNAIVREYGGLYEFIVDFYYEWGRILREEGSSIRNKAAYMKVRMWDWMKRWQIEKESIMAELE